MAVNNFSTIINTFFAPFFVLWKMKNSYYLFLYHVSVNKYEIFRKQKNFPNHGQQVTQKTLHNRYLSVGLCCANDSIVKPLVCFYMKQQTSSRTLFTLLYEKYNIYDCFSFKSFAHSLYQAF